MNRVDYDSAYKYPISIEGMTFIQEQIMTAAKAVAGALGNNANGVNQWIIAGCEESGTQIGAGVVAIDGQLYNVTAQTKAASCHISTTTTQTTNRTTAVLIFGTGVGANYRWSDFTRVEVGKLATKSEVEELRNLVMPSGAIVMWSGAISAIPTGYALCDGGQHTYNSVTVTTPDLRGRFVVGYDVKREGETSHEADTDYTSVGNSGGEKKHTLTIAEMPSHNHTIHGDTIRKSGTDTKIITLDSLKDWDGGDSEEFGQKIAKAGGDQPHENRPPYYVLAFIMRIG